MSKSSHKDKGYFLYVLQNKENIRGIAICFINISNSHIPLIVEYLFW